MDWATERESLEVLQRAPTVNSSLKKKLAIINKLRNISNEPFPQIVADIKAENLHKFYTEIINSLLSNTKLQNHSDVHKIVRVIYLYSYDSAFISNITIAIKKRFTDSWVNGAIFAEIYFLLNKQINTITKTLISSESDGQLQLVLYLLCSFPELDLSHIRQKITELINKDTEKSIDILSVICAKIGMDVKLVAPPSYVGVIKPVEGEFSFYQAVPAAGMQLTIPQREIQLSGSFSADGLASTGDQEKSPNNIETENIPTDALTPLCSKRRTMQFNPGMLRRIADEPRNAAFLDFISANIDGNTFLINKVMKKRRIHSMIPAIARIISKLTKGRKEAILQLCLGDAEQLTHNDLIFIGELYKFGTIKLADVFNLLNRYLNQKMAEKFCILFENVGRYMLLSKEANRVARDMLERLKNANANGIEKLFISDCLSKIFQTAQLKVDILDFLHWFFREKNFTESKMFQKILASKKFLLICFLQPELFESEDFLTRVIKQAGLEAEMIQLYADTLCMMLSHSRHHAFRIASILGSLLREAAPERQSAVLDAFCRIGVSCATKQKMLIVLLDHCGPAQHHKYLHMFLDAPVSAEVQASFFNFCERHHYYVEVNADIDSFEAAMEALGE